MNILFCSPFSYNELLRGLAPAPGGVCGGDVEVGHVGVVVQVVHPLPHRPRHHLPQSSQQQIGDREFLFAIKALGFI